MAGQYGFPFKSKQDIFDELKRLEVTLPWSDDVSALAAPVSGKGYTLPNALAVHPMEGCDGLADGSPGELTYRRYLRFARGGAGLIWLEAVAVCPESRANPNQLMITRENLDSFRLLAQQIREEAEKTCGIRPLIIVQLTQSGRWSRPVDKPAPIKAWHFEPLDAHQKLPPDYAPVNDDYLATMPAAFAQSAALCREAGFDGVDVKGCHLYLYSELLGATERPAPYGGTYECRTLLLKQSVEAVNKAVGPDWVVASRLNVHDNTAGRWGTGADGEPALDEPTRLIGELKAMGINLFNITMGTPYFNPHINRPYATGGYEPPEPPLRGVARLQNGVRRIQAAHPDVVCVGTGYSYMRQYAGYVAAGAVAEGWARVVGFGRMAFACPDFANEILKNGAIPSNKACLTCGKCTMLMRAHTFTGCPVRDQEEYLARYRAI